MSVNISKFRAKKSQSILASGPSLVADFTAAITNISTAETAKYEAEQSELSTINTIEAASQGAFVMPQYIPSASQESLVRSSLDAHIKKVQANQITAFTSSQIAQMEAEDRQKYCGRKVRVIVLDPSASPVESYWYNDKTGEYSSGVMKSKQVRGIIEDISLSKNMIILKPTITSRIILPGRKYYAVFVIDPLSLAPLISIEFK